MTHMGLESGKLTVVLASSSPYRRQLLGRLLQRFESVAADIDETPLAGESAQELVQRLAETKARSVASQYPHQSRPALIIGSDQVAVMGTDIIGKPGGYDKAVKQLQKLSGKSLTFLTGLCVFDNRSASADVCCVPCQVRFRTLDDSQIHAYLAREPALDCAGAFKSEGLGIALLEQMDSADPTALIGLPLMTLSQMLRRAGYDVIADGHTTA